MTTLNSAIRHQERVNDKQEVVNVDQNEINEQTKIDLNIRNFWGIIVFAITITSIYLYNQFSITSDLRAIKSDVTYIRSGLEKHLSDSEKARADMRLISSERDAHFSDIEKELVRIKALLKIN